MRKRETERESVTGRDRKIGRERQRERGGRERQENGEREEEREGRRARERESKRAREKRTLPLACSLFRGTSNVLIADIQANRERH